MYKYIDYITEHELYGHKLELSVFLFVTLLFSMMSNVTIAQTSDDNDSGDASTITPDLQGSSYLQVISNSEGHLQTLHIPSDQMIFNVTPIYDDKGNQVSFSLSLKHGYNDFYQQAGLFDKPKNIVFIYPSFTQAAYGSHGFYDYYRKQCDSSCLTVPIPDGVHGSQASSIVSAWILKLLDYPYVMDQDIDKNPDILKQYKRVIVLHNEYVTQREFDAITSHPDVIFLYPNALYAKVTANYDNGTITLIHGHGYPDASVKNGVGWKYDNTKYEYDVHCNDWEFYHAGNDLMLNCYPEYEVLFSKDMLSSLQRSDPTDLLYDITYWLNHTEEKTSSAELLDDYGISGTKMPSWLSSPATWVLNGQITKREFGDILMYLNANNIIE